MRRRVGPPFCTARKSSSWSTRRCRSLPDGHGRPHLIALVAAAHVSHEIVVVLAHRGLIRMAAVPTREIVEIVHAITESAIAVNAVVIELEIRIIAARAP